MSRNVLLVLGLLGIGVLAYMFFRKQKVTTPGLQRGTQSPAAGIDSMMPFDSSVVSESFPSLSFPGIEGPGAGTFTQLGLINALKSPGSTVVTPTPDIEFGATTSIRRVSA